MRTKKQTEMGVRGKGLYNTDLQLCEANKNEPSSPDGVRRLPEIKPEVSGVRCQGSEET